MELAIIIYLNLDNSFSFNFHELPTQQRRKLGRAYYEWNECFHLFFFFLFSFEHILLPAHVNPRFVFRTPLYPNTKCYSMAAVKKDLLV